MTNSAKPRPTIVIIGTGGTIAGRGAAGNTSSYDAAVLGIQDIVAAVPQLAQLADIRGEQIMNLPSKNMTDRTMIDTARSVARIAASDADGVVVTHGTDTIEETAYFLNLTIKSAKPIVLVGAMRPSTSLSADGPINLYDAVRVACSKDAAGKGVLLVMNGEIHSARDVTKRNTFQVGAFGSPYGPLGLAVEGHEIFYRAPTRAHTLASDFDIAYIDSLPNVQVIYGHSNVSDVAVRAFIECAVEGIVYAGTGNANLPDALIPALHAARAAGIHVVRASRTGSGSAVRNPDAADLKNGWIVADDQNPQKARLLLALALTRTRKVSELQSYFQKY
ncbi:MAG: asparaginase [Pseudolabrys sp.]|nr:asparaginase [Pseudolabrys sp.]MDP2295399.1 asparaginase [Pseudolabrys sp.]